MITLSIIFANYYFGTPTVGCTLKCLMWYNNVTFDLKQSVGINFNKLLSHLSTLRAPQFREYILRKEDGLTKCI